MFIRNPPAAVVRRTGQVRADRDRRQTMRVKSSVACDRPDVNLQHIGNRPVETILSSIRLTTSYNRGVVNLPKSTRIVICRQIRGMSPISCRFRPAHNRRRVRCGHRVRTTPLLASAVILRRRDRHDCESRTAGYLFAASGVASNH